MRQKKLIPDEVVPLSQAADSIFLGLTLGRPGKSPANMIAVPIVTMKDIQGGIISPPSDLHVQEITESEFSRFQLAVGDVLVTARSSLKVASVEPRHIGAIAGPNLIVVRPGKRLAGPLLLAFLSHPTTRDKLEQLSVATTVKSLNVKAVSAVPVRIPPAELQEKLALLASLAHEQFIAATRAAEIRKQLADRVLIEALAV